MTEQKKLWVIAGVTLAVYLTIRYLLPFVIPFLLAWILVRASNPLLKKIRSRLPWKKEILMSILIFLVFAAVGIALYFLCAAVLDQIFRALSNFDNYYRQMGIFFDDCCLGLEQKTGIRAERLRLALNRGLENLQVRMNGEWIPNLLNHSFQYLMRMVGFVGFLFIVFIAVLLLMRDYEEMRARLEEYESFQRVKHVADQIFQTGGAYLRSQCIILFVIIVLCVGGLYLLGSPYALLLGIVIGILDALPFLGTGTILIPWAAVLALQKRYWLAAGYLGLFLVTNTVRELMEPKLVGKRIGIYPFVFAAAVYAGFGLFGPAGVLLGPVGLVLIMEICREIFGTADGQEAGG